MKTTRIFTILALALGLLLSAGQVALAGSIMGWGRNGEGQIDVPAGNDFVAIAAGWRHSLALKSDGSIVGWGEIFLSQIDVPAGNDFVAIAAAAMHSLALKSDGSIVGWGSNAEGQIDVPAGNDFVAIAGGWYHSLALKSDGSIVGWGLNDHGQVNVPAGNDFVAIAAGWCHSLALKSDGSIVGWGSNAEGEIDVPAGNDFVAIAAGNHHGLALKSDGSIVGWGRNAEGQIDVPAGNDFVAIAAAGGSHGLALKSDGSIVGWGDNWIGQIDVPAGNDFVAIAAGVEHSLALRVIPLVSGFTYQGRLMDAGMSADGLYDLEFKLFDDAASGTQIGDTITVRELDVIDGYFTVALDFPSDPNTFNGAERWLQIGVRPGNSTDSFTILSPRQKITPVPYALHALSSGPGPGPMVGGSGTDSYIPKWLGTTDLEDSVIYQDGANKIGIGTTSPKEKLDVSQGNIILSEPGGTMRYIMLQRNGGNVGSMSTANGRITIGAESGYDAMVQNSSGDGIILKDSSGNVGVGTISPKEKLDVSQGNIILSEPGGTMRYIMLQRNGGNVGSMSTANGHITIGAESGYDAMVQNSSGDGIILKDSSGNVGIGTTSPGRRLHVESAEDGQIEVRGTDPTRFGGLVLRNDGQDVGIVGVGGMSNPNSDISRNLFLSSPADYGIVFQHAGKTRVVIDDRGYVGIGTTSPARELDAAGTIRTSGSASGTWTSASWGKRLEIPTAGVIQWLKGAGNTISRGIGFTTDDKMYFIRSSADDHSAAANYDMVIDKGGNIGIGVTAPSYRLELPNNPNASGRGLANAWSTYSSRNLKKNIEPIENALDKVKRLRGVYFDWKENGIHDIGMIAEEVGEVIPEVVDYEDNGVDAASLSYGRLVALLIEAVKEQQCRIVKLEEIIAEREPMERRLEALERMIQQGQVVTVKEVQQ